MTRSKLFFEQYFRNIEDKLFSVDFTQLDFEISALKKAHQLKKLGDINLWVNNKSYNFVENIHQIWLLAITDLIIGKREYPA
jgi:hypothetical protein